MRKTISAILVIMAIAAGISVLGSDADAKYLFPPCDCNDGGGGNS
jgi:hypothetical protein